MGNLGLGFGIWILTLIGAVTGAIIFLGLVPIVQMLRGISGKPGRWRRRLLLVLVTTLLFPGVLCMWMTAYGEDYWRYPGWDEFWRAPLQYPYELKTESIVPETFCVGRWHEKECVISNVAGYSQQDSWVIGVIGEDEEWFTLHMSSNEVTIFRDVSEFRQAVVEQGLMVPTEFEPSGKSVRAYWDTHP